MFKLPVYMLVCSALATTAAAREVRLLTFDIASSGGEERQLAPPESDISMVSPAAPEPPLAQLSFPTDRLQVPRWMRGSAVIGGGVASPLPTTPVFTSGCTREPYRPNRKLTLASERRRIALYSLMEAAACEAGIPTHLLDAVIIQESRYNSAAVSSAGAMGLSQLMPDTARGMGVTDVFDPLSNLRGGARYLRAQLDEFGRYDLALSAYNAGPGRVRATRRIPRISETINYVAAIMTDLHSRLTDTLPQRARYAMLQRW